MCTSDSFSRESRVRGQESTERLHVSQIHIDWLLKADRRSQHRKKRSTPRQGGSVSMYPEGWVYKTDFTSNSACSFYFSGDARRVELMSKEAATNIIRNEIPRIQDPGEPLRDRAERNTDQMQIVIKILQLPVGRIEGPGGAGAGGSRENWPHNSPSGASTP